MVFWLDYNSCSHFRSSQAREQPSSGLKQELPDQTAVYANKSIHCLYTQAFYTEKLYMCALLYIFRYMLSPILRRSSYRVQICGESTLGFEFERSQRFLFFFGISIWTMHHQLAKRAVIVVIICLSEECFQLNQCFNQWSPLAPAKYIFYRATKRRLYLIRKSGGKKTRIVTFSGKLYIVSSIVCHLTKLENMGLFLN